MHGCYTCMQVIINFIVATCTCTFMLEGKCTMTCTAARGGGHSASLVFYRLGLDSRLTVWRCSCMLMCACAKRLELRHHENKIREILCRVPSAKIYTLEIHPLYGACIPYR